MPLSLEPASKKQPNSQLLTAFQVPKDYLAGTLKENRVCHTPKRIQGAQQNPKRGEHVLSGFFFHLLLHRLDLGGRRGNGSRRERNVGAGAAISLLWLKGLLK
jgi:hypothetical protein